MPGECAGVDNADVTRTSFWAPRTRKKNEKNVAPSQRHSGVKTPRVRPTYGFSLSCLRRRWQQRWVSLSRRQFVWQQHDFRHRGQDQCSFGLRPAAKSVGVWGGTPSCRSKCFRFHSMPHVEHITSESEACRARGSAAETNAGSEHSAGTFTTFSIEKNEQASSQKTRGRNGVTPRRTGMRRSAAPPP